MTTTHAADIIEDRIARLSPDLLSLLLKDHTTSKENEQRNIFWATHDYEPIGAGYEYHSPILPALITGSHGHVIMPRVLKSRGTQRDRSRGMAEVFTPSWICNAQNNLVDAAWFGREGVFNRENADHSWTVSTAPITFPEGKTWRDYVRLVRLEITCGEAPYLASRYDTTTGEPIPVRERIGLLDRKLRVVGENTESASDWLRWAQAAFQSVYGYEWQGDSLLIARENLLMTFVDYFRDKFHKDPAVRSLLYIAYIVSWNLWQMDGLRGVVPDSCGTKPTGEQSLFGDAPETKPCEGCAMGDIRRHNGTYCLVRDWAAKPPKDRIRFIDLLKH